MPPQLHRAASSLRRPHIGRGDRQQAAAIDHRCDARHRRRARHRLLLQFRRRGNAIDLDAPPGHHHPRPIESVSVQPLRHPGGNVAFHCAGPQEHGKEGQHDRRCESGTHPSSPVRHTAIPSFSTPAGASHGNMLSPPGPTCGAPDLTDRTRDCDESMGRGNICQEGHRPASRRGAEIARKRPPATANRQRKCPAERSAGHVYLIEASLS